MDMRPNCLTHDQTAARRQSAEFEVLGDDELAALRFGAIDDLDETTMDRPRTTVEPDDSDLEGRVLRGLSSDTALEFDALTVRRVVDGVVVEGVVRGVDGRPDESDLSELIREISGLDGVDNRLVVVGGRGG